MKKEIIFSEENVKIKKIMMREVRSRNFFCIFLFLFLRIFWARKQRGASQQLKIIRGEESLSEPNL